MCPCPSCGSTFTRRIPRTTLMRLTFVSKHILCSHCGERSLIHTWNRKAEETLPEVRPVVRTSPRHQKFARQYRGL